MAREFREVRKNLSGDSEAAAPYIGLARTMLGNLKTQMAFGKLLQLSRNYILEDGTSITVSSIFGQDAIRINAGSSVPATEEQELVTTEEKEKFGAGRGQKYRIMGIDYNTGRPYSFYPDGTFERHPPTNFNYAAIASGEGSFAVALFDSKLDIYDKKWALIASVATAGTSISDIVFLAPNYYVIDNNAVVSQYSEKGEFRGSVATDVSSFYLGTDNVSAVYAATYTVDYNKLTKISAKPEIVSTGSYPGGQFSAITAAGGSIFAYVQTEDGAPSFTAHARIAKFSSAWEGQGNFDLSSLLGEGAGFFAVAATPGDVWAVGVVGASSTFVHFDHGLTVRDTHSFSADDLYVSESVHTDNYYLGGLTPEIPEGL